MTRFIFILALTLPLLLSAGRPALAVEPDEMLANTTLEARAREISKGLRCVVCQNQSIDESNAPIARDMRILVRERLLLGDKNQQVIDYFVSRYGEFVLLKPSFKPRNYPLWLGPPILAAFGFMVLLAAYRSRQHLRPVGPIEPLSPMDRKRLDELVNREITRQEHAAPNEPG